MKESNCHVEFNIAKANDTSRLKQEVGYMNDPVNHPSHYTDGKYETIEFIERHGFSFHEGNAIKYISRAGKKDPGKTIEDLEKALWYIKRASNAEDYCPEAITAHDYILDKKLSPALASAIALIEASEYEKAENMLEAEIKRLKEEKKSWNACETICRYAPPEKKWPCVDCDMRYHDRAEEDQK